MTVYLESLMSRWWCVSIAVSTSLSHLPFLGCQGRGMMTMTTMMIAVVIFTKVEIMMKVIACFNKLVSRAI